MRIFVLILCIALIAPAAFAARDENTVPPVQMSTDLPAAKLGFRGGVVYNCTGKWKTNWGEMLLTQYKDGSVTGEYTYDKGKIEGKMSGNLLSGTWSEAPTYQGNHDSGLIEFQFNEDCSVFKGRWKYGTTGSWKEGGWTGEKIQGAQKFSPF